MKTKKAPRSKVDSKITWEEGTKGMALLRVAAMYVDLADQILGQNPGRLPGIQRNREIAWEIGCLSVGRARFARFVRDAVS